MPSATPVLSRNPGFLSWYHESQLQSDETYSSSVDSFKCAASHSLFSTPSTIQTNDVARWSHAPCLKYLTLVTEDLAFNLRLMLPCLVQEFERSSPVPFTPADDAAAPLLLISLLSLPANSPHPHFTRLFFVLLSSDTCLFLHYLP